MSRAIRGGSLYPSYGAIFPYDKGKEDFASGIALGGNPYHNLHQNSQFRSWNCGWLDASYEARCKHKEAFTAPNQAA